MQIKMIHGEGKETRAKSASLALNLWFVCRCKSKLPRNPKSFEVYTQDHLNHPTAGQPFLDIVVAACEREFNKFPEIKEDDFEKQCWSILEWLSKHGDVTQLSCSYKCNLDQVANAVILPPEEKIVLDEGSDHPHSCRCDTCKQWWKLMGPDPDNNMYGPFTKEEIEEL
jgi:hypothetical protein